MCTVTFIPGSDHIYITSNRDEKLARSTAQTVAHHPGKSGTLMYPRDPDGGGTWMAVHERGDAAVLLNGAHQRHIPLPSYRMSRGRILLDLLDQYDPGKAFESISLDGIQPFTAILLEGGCLTERRWDGEIKMSRMLNPTQPQIWSSVTLYESSVIEHRKQWYSEWLPQHPLPTPLDIMEFHAFADQDDPGNGLQINSSAGIATVSICCLEIGPDSFRMHYLDLRAGSQAFLDLRRTHSTVSK
jgi:hypothetical protein